MARRPPMSMEAMMDEERREVLALLEGAQPTRPRAPSLLEGRSPSPFTTPRSPVRSMLDIGDDPPSPTSPRSARVNAYTKQRSQSLAPVRSMLDVDSPPLPPVRSMLVVDSPPPSIPSPRQALSHPSSPVETNSRAHAANQALPPRSMSDAAMKPADFGPRSSGSRLDPTDYQFGGIITHSTGHTLPKRVTQGGKRQGPGASSMAEVMRGNDVSSLVLPGDKGRHYSLSAAPPRIQKSKSKSPHSRLSLRSNSPHINLPDRPLSPAGQALVAETMNYDNAYRRLSDAALARSGGSLSEFGRRKRSDDAGNGRLAKDYLSPDGDLLVEDSSEDGGSSSEDEVERGRRAARSYDRAGAGHGISPQSTGSISPETKKTAQSLMAAAEEERIQVASQQPAYHYRSLLDEPEITITGPSGDRVRHAKTGIHPATSFDFSPSGSRTPVDSDTEADITDIKRAQKLAFSMTQIMDTPESHRTIQIITRGEYARLVQEGEEEHRRPRKYLVATDMSEESTHALEWAIGTVLRDGDTLLAIYCVDEETGIVPADGVPDEPKAIKEQATAINVVTTSKTPITPGGTVLPLHHKISPLSYAGDGTGASVSPAPSGKERSKAQEERYRAVQDISERVTKLLRKTRLQVRVIVEVLHCKNPRHLITEVIDLVSPTLVILGSRGRSALKGVILGSFSNYLVTKSSVPVMVARKRLRKQTKYKRLPATHQVNNINNPTARSLANAKID
ncbi:hypothetical protein B0T19DRAFT_93275 [Cercophora scortea]|uniref:UspA domain-containing protein n=1 Tax=Cercophora scortea TaxID=314031 RepID=A0AAE0MI90_9PEZI|nr:hypothetical protein B0T19DRAFT_93275 [Cercophora scortea]